MSLLVPARDEEASIGAALRAALASEGVELEVVVLDDGSTDRSALLAASRSRLAIWRGCASSSRATSTSSGTPSAGSRS